MRERILDILRNFFGSYVSGEELSSHLGVSRTIIWRHVKALKGMGYEIDGTTRAGYRLTKIPDLLLPEEIKAVAGDNQLIKEIHYYQETESTNLAARQAAHTGCPEGTIIIAEAQGKGRGRMQRSWYSPYAKGIWCSLILRPRFKPYDAAKITLLVAVAVRQALSRYLHISCGIKWPNDILVEGKKICGILTEINTEIDNINYILVGFGVNVNISAEEFPDELKSTATSISALCGKVSRLELLAAILENFTALYETANAGDFSSILSLWREYSVTIGKQVDIFDGDKQFTGKAVDIDEDGGLLVATEGGIRKVLAGDVSIRAKAGDIHAGA